MHACTEDHSMNKSQIPLREAITVEEEEEQQQHQEERAFEPELLGQALDLEIQGIRAAEAGDLDGALEEFGQAIQLLPERASAYNNRGQALRLKGDAAGALEDLATALQLSKGAGRVARQALVQRGLIRRLQGHEEGAREDFAEAARLGSAFARQQLVLTSPYAALCNQMLSQMMRRLRGPEPSSEAEPLPGPSVHPAGSCLSQASESQES